MRAEAIQILAERRVFRARPAILRRLETELGAPTSFVNGPLVPGARTYRVFRYEIERALLDQL